MHEPSTIAIALFLSTIALTMLAISATTTTSIYNAIEQYLVNANVTPLKK